MNQPESDLVQRAAATLRGERSGQNPGSGFTRARILNDLRSKRNKRSRWWRIGFPIGMLLAGTTAWASANGSLPAVWITVSTLLNLPLTDNGTSERSLAASSAQKDTGPVGERSAAKDAPLILENTSSEPPGTSVNPDDSLAPAEEVAHLPVSHPSLAPTASRVVSRGEGPALRKSSSERAKRVAAPATSLPTQQTSPSTPELEAEINAFRAADNLYRHRRELGAAVDAYRRYVREFPSGRFVPEANYNAALALIELGRNDEARPLLDPFAAGVYGTYRQNAARKLLDALAR